MGLTTLCPDCLRAMREMAPEVGYYCVFCHLAVTVSLAGGYALVLKDDAQNRRQSRRVALETLRPSE